MFVAINYKKEMKKELFIACSLCGTMLVNAENIEVTSFKYAGPYELMQPYQVDSVDVNSKSWKAGSLLKTPVSFSLLEGAEVKQANQLSPSSGYALHLMGFVLENTHYGEVSLKVEGAEHYQVYVDGKHVEDASLALNPATQSGGHQVSLHAGRKERSEGEPGCQAGRGVYFAYRTRPSVYTGRCTAWYPLYGH